MAPLIGAVWLLLLMFYAYRAGQVLLGDRTARTRVLDRTGRPDQRPEPTAPDSPAEAQEGELARRLLAGTVGQVAYQRQMSELARTSATRAGGRK